MYRLPEKPEDGAGSLGVDGTCQSGRWNPNLGPLQEQELFTPGLSLASPQNRWIFTSKEKGKRKKLNRKIITFEWKFTEIRNPDHCTHGNTVRAAAIRKMSLEETLSY